MMIDLCVCEYAQINGQLYKDTAIHYELGPRHEIATLLLDKPVTWLDSHFACKHKRHMQSHATYTAVVEC